MLEFVCSLASSVACAAVCDVQCKSVVFFVFAHTHTVPRALAPTERLQAPTGPKPPREGHFENWREFCAAKRTLRGASGRRPAGVRFRPAPVGAYRRLRAPTGTYGSLEPDGEKAKGSRSHMVC